MEAVDDHRNGDPTSETGPEPEPEHDAVAHKKHAAMLQRLSDLHQSRSATRRQPEPEPESQSLTSFLSLFSSSKLSIESSISLLLSSLPKPEPAAAKSDLDRISASISDLERVLAQNTYFLPSYELRSALKSISDLKETLEKASSDLIPRKKFSFKNKSSSKKDPAELFKQDEARPDLPASFKDTKDSPGFRSQKGAVLVKNFRVLEDGKGEFTLSDLDSCEVYLKGRIRALFINRISNCRIFCGAVLGSILIEDVRGSLLMLASHQIRIHQAKETDFYLRVRSRPIIEDCCSVRFSPYRFCYEGIDEDLRSSRLDEETENWANVDDFKWLRAVQSPNWRLIPEDERVQMVDASDLKENCGDC